MATYLELYDLAQNSALKNRIAVAIMLATEVVRNEDGGTTNHANRLLWAKEASLNPGQFVQPFLNAALAQNASLTVAQINAASDAGLLTAVTNVIDILRRGASRWLYQTH